MRLTLLWCRKFYANVPTFWISISMIFLMALGATVPRGLSLLKSLDNNGFIADKEAGPGSGIIPTIETVSILLLFPALVGLLVCASCCYSSEDDDNDDEFELPATSPQIIEALPLRKFTLGKVSLNDSMACVICLEDFIQDELVRTLPCNHDFHRACIDVWLSKRRNMCPICRFVLLSIEEQLQQQQLIQHLSYLTHSEGSQTLSIISSTTTDEEDSDNDEEKKLRVPLLSKSFEESTIQLKEKRSSKIKELTPLSMESFPHLNDINSSQQIITSKETLYKSTLLSITNQLNIPSRSPISSSLSNITSNEITPKPADISSSFCKDNP